MCFRQRRTGVGERKTGVCERRTGVDERWTGVGELSTGVVERSKASASMTSQYKVTAMQKAYAVSKS